jgi:broad specificity phosphatase PhoE
VADETTELYLIRHGESVANVTPIIGGMRGDAGLTDRGREQAQLLEKRLREARRGHSTFGYSPTTSCTSCGPARPTA